MYRRTYEWDDKNQLIKSQDDNVTVCYTYGSDGQRASKYTENSETLYTNNFWVFHVSGSVRNGAGIINKNIYLGKMRVVTKVKEAFDSMEITERQCQYFYHSDHLGSAQLVTDNKGNEYQRIEYTPYGETWIDLKATQNDLVKLNYKFTAKELDEETGLYYYGARYLNPKYSMWISCDPALSYYVEGKSNGTSGGIYNSLNFNLYHYAGNNPIRYVDPTGMEEDVSDAEKQLKRLKEIGEELFHKGTINGINLYLENSEDGCFARATVIAGELEKEGFEVTDYSYVTSPILPGVIKAEKAAGRDPSKVLDKDEKGNPNRFRFHVAATVIIDGKKYVVDPFYHKSWLSISGQDDWYSCQYPKGTSTQPAHDAKGNLIAPATMKLLRTRSGYTGTMPIIEYAQGWLKNYDKVKRDNKKNNTNNDPYIWSGK